MTLSSLESTIKRLLVQQYLSSGEESSFPAKNEAGQDIYTALREFLSLDYREHTCLWGFIVWYVSCTGETHRERCRVVRTAQRIIGIELPNLDTVYACWLHTKASRIIMDPTHPGRRMFVPLPSGKRYKAIKSRTNRLKHSFCAKAVAALRPPTPPHPLDFQQ